jgi:hypothetical protein
MKGDLNAILKKPQSAQLRTDYREITEKASKNLGDEIE